MTALVPVCIHVLHVAIKAAKLSQELCLVQILFVCLNASLDSWFLIESSVCIVLCIVDCFTKHVIVFEPFVELVCFWTLLGIWELHRVIWVMVPLQIAQSFIVLPWEVKDFNLEQIGQDSRLVGDCFPHNIFETRQLPNHIVPVLRFVPIVSEFYKFCDSYAHGDEELWGTIYTHLVRCIFKRRWSILVRNSFTHIEWTMADGVIQDRGRP